MKKKILFFSVSILIFYCLMFIFSFFFIKNWQSPVGSAFASPSLKNCYHWFGTDIFGRSILLKILKSNEVAFSLAFITILMTTPIGFCLGALAGYFQQYLDPIIIWLITIFNSVPAFMLLIVITVLLGKGWFALIAAITLTSWTGFAKIIRAEVMSLKQKEYVLAARALGFSSFRILAVHILPNLKHLVLYHISLQFISVIKFEIVLSFLGLGIKHHPSWGIMMDDGKLELARGFIWQALFAILSMFFILFAFQVFIEYLKDKINEKSTAYS